MTQPQKFSIVSVDVTNNNRPSFTGEQQFVTGKTSRLSDRAALNGTGEKNIFTLAAKDPSDLPTPS